MGGTVPSNLVVDSTLLATTGMVSSTTQFVVSSSHDTTRSPNVTIKFSSPDSPLTPGQEFASDGLAHIRGGNTTTDLSESALRFINNSIRVTTKRSYASCWKRWLDWCKTRKIDPCHPNENIIVNYLAALLELPLAINTVMIHKSAIYFYLQLGDKDIRALSTSSKIQRLFRGAFNSRPPKPRAPIWNADVVLSLFLSWGDNSTLPLKRLFLKSLRLLALVSACRISELASLSRLVVKESFGWEFRFTKWKKNSSQKRPSVSLKVASFEDSRLCPLACLELYLLKSTVSAGNLDSLFITLCPPYKRPRPNTLAKHLKVILEQAGFPSGSFSAHSFRAASASKAASWGVPIDIILSQATWARFATFQKFYSKKVMPNKPYADAILQL
jgi:integrase